MNKRAKSAHVSGGKRVKDYSEKQQGKRIVSAPLSASGETPLWLLSQFDYSGPWGAAACASANCEKHIKEHLKGIESMTWAEILSQSGGKTHGTNHHSIRTEMLSRKAQARLAEIGLDDTDDVFSLRFEGTVRLYGLREGRVLKLLWLDPWHDDADRAVCPSGKKRT